MRNRPRVTASLIVKNEAEHLGACLDSLVDVVDETIVVDTGSTDATVEIARSHGAHVLHHVWSDSFSAARNFGLEHASGDWILYIDADERLTAPTTRAEMHAALDAAERERVAAFKVHFTLVQSQTHAYEWRMWRHHPDIRFEGIIHESIAPSIHRVLGAGKLRHRNTDAIRISHLGYEGDQSAKNERNLPLLLAEIDRTPQRPYLYDHAARILERLNRHDEARAMWERGMQVARDLGEGRRPIDSLCHADMAMRAIDRAGTIWAVDDSVIDEGFALFPQNWVIRWAVALKAMSRRDFETAAAIAREIIEASPEVVHATGLTYPRRLFADWPWHALGMCRFEQGRYSEAADAFSRATDLAPGTAEYVAKRDLARAKAARSDVAT